eukprot:gb/GECH01006288.1/.p1 GENE.gb/GECH01006288.1/~~gb/GECH01006288.1/.p1  ORF type:complete len:543 (+),score=122.25 gb/GECH01006288.1/:1-1629(+)
MNISNIFILLVLVLCSLTSDGSPSHPEINNHPQQIDPISNNHLKTYHHDRDELTYTLDEIINKPKNIGKPCPQQFRVASQWHQQQRSINDQSKHNRHHFNREMKSNYNKTNLISSSDSLSPILLVPGYSGSFLDSQSFSISSQNLFQEKYPSKCLKYFGSRNHDKRSQTKNRHRVWIDLEMLLPLRSQKLIDCFYETLRIDYNSTTGEYIFPKEISVFPVEEYGTGKGGGTNGVDYFFKNSFFGAEFLSYYGKLIEHLEDHGYKRKKNLFALPYDWRVTPDYLEQFTNYESQTIQLIENMRQSNNDRPVILVSHSMGNLLTLRFLNRRSGAWLKKNVAGMMSVAGPWGGVNKSIRDILSGDDIIGNNWYETTFDIFDRLRVRDLAQSYGALQWMMPSLTLWKDFPLVKFLEQNETFTGNDISEIMAQTGGGHDIARSIYSRVKSFLPSLKPNIPMYCFNGHGIPTERHYQYQSKDNVDFWPKVYCGDGDGTVPWESSSGICRWWQKNTNWIFDIKEYKNDHLGLLQDDQVIGDIFKAVQEIF